MFCVNLLFKLGDKISLAVQIDHLVMQKNQNLLKPPHVQYSTVLYSLCSVTECCVVCVQEAPAGGGSFAQQDDLFG